MLRHFVLVALSCVPLAALALHPTPAEIREICADAEGAAHCGRLVETVQLQRLPGLARRDGADLHPSLLRAAASAPLTAEARFDETSFRARLARFALAFTLEGQAVAPRLTGATP